MIKQVILLPLIFLLTSAWTFEVIDKPGSDAMVSGLEARDAAEYPQALQAFQQAYDEAVDYPTKARALAAMASIHLSQEPVTKAKFSEAVSLLERAEAMDYPRATLLLGDTYKEGKAGNADYEKAFAYYNQVKHRYTGAIISMAEMVSTPQEARDYIAQASDKLETTLKPSTQDILRLARHFRDGTIISQNIPLAEYWYGQGVKHDSMYAMVELANLWTEQGHEPREEVTALWKRAAELGNDRAMLEMGYAHALGDGVPRDASLTEQYFNHAVQLKPENAYRIARWYQDRTADNPDYKEVYDRWIQLAASHNHPDALIQIARSYWEGEGVPMNRATARKLYRQAARGGSQKARMELAKREQRLRVRQARIVEKARQKEEKARLRAMKRNRGGTSNEIASFAQLLPKAEAGDHRAMLRVGEAYIQGSEVDQNTAKGIEWVEKAAARGNGEAMYALAQIYSTGLGVSTNITKAYEWYERSANAGYAAGQYQLGLGYARGIGVSKDQEKAREWLDKASKNGYERANEILSTLMEPQS